jgi:enoyl-CoA hydratase
MDEPVLVTRPEPGITVVTLNRPERLNALTNEMLELLLGILGEIERDPQCRAVILTGAGRGFCGGLDLQANAQAISQVGDRVEDSVAWAERFGALAPALRNLRQPVVAAVNGPAAGGGLVLALAADIRVASSDALFLNGFINTGASGCELGLSYLLPRQIGMARAMELALTGRPIDAGEAERIGLVASVTASDVVEAAAVVARRILEATAFGAELTKSLMWAGMASASLEATVDLEARSQVLALMTPEAAEKRAAFTGQLAARRRDVDGSGDGLPGI